LEPAPFTVQPGTEQVAVLEAAPGEDLELVDPDGEERASGVVDGQGALLFRDVPADDGYTIRSATSRSEPFEIDGPDEHPPAEFYRDQPLLPAGGFGYITVRDGTTLSANVVLPGPADAGPYPTVVEYSGYDPSNPANTTFAQVYNALGFAYVGVNMRGTGCSGGSYRYFETVQNVDGYDVVEAVAAQPWVEFNAVGMVGVSYPGIAQLFVAQTQPPHLAAITPLSVIDDSYRATLYPGGILNTGFAVEWTSDRMDAAAPFGQDWTRERADDGDGRCADNQVLRLQNPDLVAEIGASPYYDEVTGDPLAPITFVDRIEVPVFLAGAWQDEQTGGHFPRMLDRFTATPRLDVTLVNGLHAESMSPPIFGRLVEFLQLYVARDVPTMGAANAIAPLLSGTVFGVDQVEPYPERFAGLSYEEAKAAFEAEPSVRVLLEQGGASGFPPGAPQPLETATYPAWPVASAVPQDWFLAEGGVLADDAGVPGQASYTADPDALPTTFYGGDGSGLWRAGTEYDWQPIPAGTGLGFVTAPLPADVTIMGAGVVELALAADAADTDVEVTLSEVRPDGTEIYIQSGWLRASRRALDEEAGTELAPVLSFAEEDVEPLRPGQTAELAVPLLPVAHPLRAGSRLRLTIDAPGNNRPVWAFETLSDGERVTVDYGAAQPSRLSLPVVTDIALQPAPPACGALRGQPCRPYVPASNGG
jgi:predicted acyl esterase